MRRFLVVLIFFLFAHDAYAQEGPASGVRISHAEAGTSGAGVEIRLTAAGSLTSSSPPVFIVDGVQLSRDGAGPFPLSSITNEDIVSIEILRNADTSIYGSQAVHGVVLITTRVAPDDAYLSNSEMPYVEEFAVRSLYPNPAQGPISLTYDLPESAEVRLEIYDLLGRLVSRTDAGTVPAGANLHMEISTSDLSAGTYVYRLVAGPENAAGRFTVVR